MPLRETLSNPTASTVIYEYGKGAVVEIETVFWPVYHVACQVALWNESFWAFI